MLACGAHLVKVAIIHFLLVAPKDFDGMGVEAPMLVKLQDAGRNSGVYLRTTYTSITTADICIKTIRL